MKLAGEATRWFANSAGPAHVPAPRSSTQAIPQMCQSSSLLTSGAPFDLRRDFTQLPSLLWRQRRRFVLRVYEYQVDAPLVTKPQVVSPGAAALTLSTPGIGQPDLSKATGSRL